MSLKYLNTMKAMDYLSISTQWKQLLLLNTHAGKGKWVWLLKNIAQIMVNQQTAVVVNAGVFIEVKFSTSINPDPVNAWWN